MNTGSNNKKRKLEIKSSSKKTMQTNTIKKEACRICLEQFECNRMFSVCVSNHRYCLSCIKRHVEVSYLNGKVAKCPHEGCGLYVKIDACTNFLAPQVMKVMEERMKEATIPVNLKVYCPNLRCSILMSKSDLMSKNVSRVSDSEVRKCFKCNRLFCLKCKVAWHYNKTCDEYQQSNPDPYGEKQMKSLAKDKGWRECSGCNNMVELSQGCYHMICRCGYEFCYVCGVQWPKNGKCKCEFWDERFIIQ